MKRVPRIKFPERHPKPFSSTSGKSPGAESQAKPSSGNTGTPTLSVSKSDIPPPPNSSGVGGLASLQPKRTPVSDKEMEAILLGGCV